MISFEALSQINRIIEHDHISSTYKYVLLKNTIDVCQRYDHLIQVKNGQANIPLGLIVEGWIFDYLPFVFNDVRQQNRGNVLNKKIENTYKEIFEAMSLFENVTTWQDAYSKLYLQYTMLELDTEISNHMTQLAKETANTITKMPMRYTGKEDYEIFKLGSYSMRKIPKNHQFNREFLLNFFDTFSISEEHYHIFRYMGQSIYGTSTIARKWKEVTYKLNSENHVIDKIDAMIYKTIFKDRNTNIGRKYLPNECYCVWSGKRLTKGKYDIDHVLPYSIWFNNDLWNLLPADSKVNNKKSDKIPSPELIYRRRDLIVSYWEHYEAKTPELFNYQIQTSLTQNSVEKQDIINALCDKADYLISKRGYDSFTIAV
jgi:hypothetical protein